jgi:hypothetical protein
MLTLTRFALTHQARCPSLSFPLRAKRGLGRALQECHLNQASYWATRLLSPYVAFASDLTCAQVLTTAQDLLAASRIRGLLPLVGNFPRSLMQLVTPICCLENRKPEAGLTASGSCRSSDRPYSLDLCDEVVAEFRIRLNLVTP